MFRVIVKRELLHNLYSLRFLISLALVLVVFAAGAISFVRSPRRASRNTAQTQGQFLETMRGFAETNATELAVRKQTYSLKPRANAFISDAKEKYLPNALVFSAWNVFSFENKSGTRQSLPPAIRRAELGLHRGPDPQLHRPALHLRRRLGREGIEDAGPVAGEPRLPGHASFGQSRERGPFGHGHRRAPGPGRLDPRPRPRPGGSGRPGRRSPGLPRGGRAPRRRPSPRSGCWPRSSRRIRTSASSSRWRSGSPSPSSSPTPAPSSPRVFSRSRAPETVQKNGVAAFDDLSKNAPPGSWTMNSGNPFLPQHELRANLQRKRLQAEKDIRDAYYQAMFRQFERTRLVTALSPVSTSSSTWPRRSPAADIRGSGKPGVTSTSTRGSS